MLFYTKWSEEGITGKATLEQVRPGRGEEVSHTLHEERMSQAEGTADAKALRWECLRISRKQPVWLERSEKKGGFGDKRDWRCRHQTCRVL